MNSTPRRTRALLAVLLAATLAMPPARALASPEPPVEHGPRRLLAYFTCALTVYLAYDSVSLMRAGTTCVTVFLAETS
jgi:hypothetical protein